MANEDLSGRKFGNLTVIGLNRKARDRANFWDCVCSCGNTIVVRGAYLKKGIKKSCGCPLIETEEPLDSVMIKVGQEVHLDPFADMTGFCSELNRGKYITAKVVYVNYPHQWFSVECGKYKQRLSFKFFQIGNEVVLCK